MITVFDYTDFRKFLRDKFAEQKSRDLHFTYRFLAAKAGFKSAGFFTQVLQGKTNLSVNMTGRLASALGLSKREERFFAWMVRFNQASSHDDKKAFFIRMTVFKRARVRAVDPQEYDFYDKWYYSAIRALLQFYPFDGIDYASLSRKVVPAIRPAEAQRAVSVLLRLGFISRDLKGIFHLTDKHLTTGPATESVIINNFVINTLDIAKDAFYNFPKEKRNFSALTLGVSDKGFQKILERSAAFRAELVDIARADADVDRVYQVNVQVFPLTHVDKDAVS